MAQNTIFIPFVGLMLLTFIVWIYMYYLRLSYMYKNRIKPEALATSQGLLKTVPEKTNLPAENLSNLFELPVLFYALCVYLYLAQQVDSIYIVLAWCFLVFRVCHSVIHCTYNNVKQRFSVYILASVSMWAMLILVVYDFFTL